MGQNGHNKEQDHLSIRICGTDGKRPTIGQKDSAIEYSTKCICSVLTKLFAPNFK